MGDYVTLAKKQRQNHRTERRELGEQSIRFKVFPLSKNKGEISSLT